MAHPCFIPGFAIRHPTPRKHFQKKKRKKRKPPTKLRREGLSSFFLKIRPEERGWRFLEKPAGLELYCPRRRLTFADFFFIFLVSASSLRSVAFFFLFLVNPTACKLPAVCCSGFTVFQPLPQPATIRVRKEKAPAAKPEGASCNEWSASRTACGWALERREPAASGARVPDWEP